jgi:hypothetical protein
MSKKVRGLVMALFLMGGSIGLLGGALVSGNARIVKEETHTGCNTYCQP